MLIQSRGNNTKTIENLTSKTEATIRLMMRVSNRRGGLSERNLLRLYNAFLMSHINYVAGALDWSRTEESKVDALMRKSIKRVLGIPLSASTEKLEQLGIHNSLVEIAEAQRTAQEQRLLSTKAGRKILGDIGYLNEDFVDHTAQIPATVRETFQVDPLPRNVHPQYNEGRRRARARTILQLANTGSAKALFVDVAQYGRSGRFGMAAVDVKGNLVTSASFYAPKATTAEQIALSIAMTETRFKQIYTDSRSAARAFLKGTIAKEAARILQGRKQETFHNITWFPAHMGHGVHDTLPNANEFAHDRARETVSRGDRTGRAPEAPREFRDALLTFNEVVTHYQLTRRTLPLAHPALTHPQSAAFRMLQTGSFPTRSRFSLFHPEIDPHCPLCDAAYCNLDHMLWQCPALQEDAELITEEEWTMALHSEDYYTQLRAVQKACVRAEVLNLPPPAQVRPASTLDGPLGR